MARGWPQQAAGERMTTIAVDATTIAADGRRIWGDQIVAEDEEKLIVGGGAILGFSGPSPLVSAVMAWWCGGHKPKNAPMIEGQEWTLVIANGHPRGVLKVSSQCPYPERLPYPVAIGAGADYAIGAMLAGASARRAVELVAMICPHTGGRVMEVNHAEMRE